MPGGGGSSILDMIIRYRNNMNLLRKRSIFSRKSSIYEDGADEASGLRKKLKFKAARPEQLIAIRSKLGQRRKEELLKTIIVLALLLPLLLWGAFSLYHTFQQNQQVNFEIEEEKAQQLRENYQFFIEDGKRWFDQGKWHNAIFQYKNARQLYSGKYEPNYLLAKAYAYRCYDEGQNCAEARILIDQLMENYPKKTDELLRLAKGMESSRNAVNPSPNQP